MSNEHTRMTAEEARTLAMQGAQNAHKAGQANAKLWWDKYAHIYELLESFGVNPQTFKDALATMPPQSEIARVRSGG